MLGGTQTRVKAGQRQVYNKNLSEALHTESAWVYVMGRPGSRNGNPGYISTAIPPRGEHGMRISRLWSAVPILLSMCLFSWALLSAHAQQNQQRARATTNLSLQETAIEEMKTH